MSSPMANRSDGPTGSTAAIIPSVVVSDEMTTDNVRAATLDCLGMESIGEEMGQLRLPANPQLARVIQQEVSAPNTPSLSRPVRSTWRIAADAASSVSQIFTDIIPGRVRAAGGVSKEKYHALLGMTLAMGSGICLTWYSFIYKTIKADIARPTVIVVRGLLQFILFFLSARMCFNLPMRVTNIEQAKNPTAKRNHFIAMATFTSLVGGLRLCLVMVSLGLLPMAMVHTILNGSPVLVMILGHLMLKNQDRLTRLKSLGGVFLVLGLVLTFQPHKTFTELDPIKLLGVLMAMLALFFSSLGSILSKKLKGHIQKPDLSAYIGISIAICGAVTFSLDELITGMEMKESGDGYQNTLRHMTEMLFPDSNMTQVEKSLSEHTNLTCVIEKYGQDLNVTHPLIATTLESTSSLFELSPLVLNSCTNIPPPYFPTEPTVWFKTLFVAFLGSMQQFALIAAVQYDLPSRVTMIRSTSILFSFLIQETLGPEEDSATWDQYLGATSIFLGIIFVASEASIKRKIQGTCLGNCFGVENIEETNNKLGKKETMARHEGDSDSVFTVEKIERGDQ